MPVLQARPFLQEELPGVVEKEDVHGPVEQVIRMHRRARARSHTTRSACVDHRERTRRLARRPLGGCAGGTRLDSPIHCESDNSSARALGSNPQVLAAVSQSGTSSRKSFWSCFRLCENPWRTSRANNSGSWCGNSSVARGVIFTNAESTSGCGRKTLAGTLRKIFNAIVKLHQKREGAVIAVRGSAERRRAISFCNMHNQSEIGLGYFVNRKQELAGNIVGEVSDELYPRLGEQAPHVKIQRVSVDDFQPVGLETSSQKIRQPRVFLDRQNLRAGGEGKLRQRAQSRPDFDDVIFRREFRPGDDPLREIPVVEEILAKRFDRRDPDLAQGRIDLGKLHRFASAEREPRKAVAYSQNRVNKTRRKRVLIHNLFNRPLSYRLVISDPMSFPKAPPVFHAKAGRLAASFGS